MSHCGALVGIDDIAYVAAADGGNEAASPVMEDASTADIVDSDIEADRWTDAPDAGERDDGGAITDGPFEDGPATRVVSWNSRVAVGSYHVCALRGPAGDEVNCFGKNEDGQLGNLTQTSIPDPGSLVSGPVYEKTMPFRGVSALVAGERHTCAMRAGEAYCWGSGPLGQVSGPIVSATRVPLQLALTPPGDVESIASGYTHVCARTERGVICWGANDRRQITATSQSDSLGVFRVSELRDMRTFALGSSFSLGLDDDGKVFCWGDNTREQCGSPGGSICPGGEGDCWLAPKPVDLPPVKAIAAGYLHACALTTDDKVKCWGSNGEGECGAYLFHCLDKWCPFGITDVAIPSGTIHLALGVQHSCALVHEEVYCWGLQDALGRGPVRISPQEQAQPRPVLRTDGTALSGIVDVAASDSLTCALSKAGEVFCWGEMPTGDRWDYAAPVP
jgi:alpha-tubulin suppressor-like RCC1 family protein